jgi:hypothetical protein
VHRLVQPRLEPLAADAGDPVQGGVAYHGTGGSGEHDKAEVEDTLRRQCGGGVQRRLAWKDRADRVPEHQEEDR